MAGQKLNILAVGIDISAANYLILVLAYALRNGHRFVSALNIAPEDLVLFNDKVKPNILLTGMSSAAALSGMTQEIELGEVLSRPVSEGGLGVPWMVFADTHRSWARPPAQGRVHCANVIVASPVEIEDAKEFGYGSAEYLGGPTHWQEFYGLKAEGAARLASEFTVYAPGIKSPAISDEFVAAVVAGVRIEYGNNWRLVFRAHPNEDKPKNEEEAREWRERRAEILNDVRLVDCGGMKSHEIVSRVDLSCFTSGAEGIPMSAIMRRPICYYESESVRQRMITQTGRPNWTPIDEGAAWRIESPEDVANAIRLSRDPVARAELQRKQERVYPPLSGDPVEKRVLDRILDLALAA